MFWLTHRALSTYEQNFVFVVFWFVCSGVLWFS